MVIARWPAPGALVVVEVDREVEGPAEGGGEAGLAGSTGPDNGNPPHMFRRGGRAGSSVQRFRRSGGRYSPTRSRDHQAPVWRRSAGVVKR